MNVTVESTGALERRMRVEVPIERIENEVKSRLQSVGKTARVKGFRPGKVPARVVRQKYGKQIRQEVLGEIMQRSYTDAVVQEKLKPAGGPRIETEGEDDKNFTYVATFEVLPEVELKDLDKIKVDKPEIEIRDEDIEDMLLSLRQTGASSTEIKSTLRRQVRSLEAPLRIEVDTKNAEENTKCLIVKIRKTTDV